jgi:uncharacterized protein
MRGVTPAVEASWRESLRQYLARAANPAHKFGHQPRLYALTRAIGEGLAYDHDAVFAAVWLHDLGVFVGHRPEAPDQLAAWDHVAYATRRAPEILADCGFPAAKVPAVLDIIRQHQPRDEPGSLEATIVRDADILEQLGAIGILRTAAKLGSDTRFHTFTDARRSLERALADLPGQIRLPATRLLAQPRIHALSSFLASLASESGLDLY